MTTVLVVILVIVWLPCIGGIIWLVHHFRQDGLHFRFFNPEQILFAKKCTKCSGGVQLLSRRGKDTYATWGPVPDELKMEVRTGGNRGYFRSPAANKRRCNCCHGVGHHWTARDEIKLPPKGTSLR